MRAFGFARMEAALDYFNFGPATLFALTCRRDA